MSGAGPPAPGGAVTPPARERWRGAAILLDLFGTVVHFAPEPDRAAGAGAARPPAMEWLRATAARVVPDVPFRDLVSAIVEVSGELARARAPEYVEVPSRERFRRALARAGVTGTRGAEAAAALAGAHMRYLRSLTRLPPEHPAVLRALRARYRLGLVSNFDDGATARQILACYGLEEFFEVVLISEEVGRRKPHPAIFREATRRLGCRADTTLFVGDSATDDVAGARAAGLPVVWLNPTAAPLPAGVPVPTYVLADLRELPALVL